jgi:cytochrome P450
MSNIITRKELKGPKGLPIIGNLHKIELSNMHNQLENWAKEFGGIYKLDLGPSKLTVITDPELNQEILKERPHLFRRMAKMDEVMKEVGVQGVFNAEGEEWKAHRRLVNKGLDVKHQQQFYPEIITSVERLYNKWNSFSNNQKPFDIQQDLLRFTVDVTTSLAFGYKMNTLEEEGGVIQEHLEKIFPMIFKRINAPIPFWRFYKTKEDKIFDNSVIVINKLIDEFIKKGKEKITEYPTLKENPSNFLESLLVAAEEEASLTDEDVRGNLLTILMAGEDTTAHTLAWAIYLLAQHPEHQEKLYKEALDVLGDKEWLENYKDHQQLVYADAIAMETMRMKPVAPLLLHEPIKDVEINGYLFTKGSRLLTETRCASMDESKFTNSIQFMPERWIKEEKGKCPMGHDTKAFIPFGAGARFCPGKNLAMLEIKLVLSMLMKNFIVELVTPKENVKEVMAFTMMASPYQVKLTKRRSAN